MKKKDDKLEISDEMIGETNGKSCCTVFADPFIKKTKKKRIKGRSKPVGRKPRKRSSKDKEKT